MSRIVKFQNLIKQKIPLQKPEDQSTKDNQENLYSENMEWFPVDW